MNSFVRMADRNVHVPLGMGMRQMRFVVVVLIVIVFVIEKRIDRYRQGQR